MYFFNKELHCSATSGKIYSNSAVNWAWVCMMKNTDQLVTKLRGLYLPKHRYANFGNVLLSMETHGIRGMSASVNFDFPITVIIGKNGSGKSTLAQLALCCYRYKQPGAFSHNMKDYYNLGNFFIKSNLDPEPYTLNAFLKYTYAISPNAQGFEQLSLFALSDDSFCHATENIIEKKNSDWGGYVKRPDRKCIYFGMGFFVPHHEMGDRIYLDPKTSVGERREFSESSLNFSAEILGSDYNAVEVATIVNQTKAAEMGFASRFGARYSENHMGCGEGRLIRMIDAIENAPEKSLIVIEEPETALHQDAQHNLAIYFLQVCSRKRHQIIVTTHSPTIVDVMPMEARKKVERTSAGTVVEDNPTIAEIIADLSNGHQKTLLIYVEDKFSKKLLVEIVRKFAPELSKAISIADVGDKGNVLQAVRYTCKHKGIKTIGIRDEAKTASEQDLMFAYPSDKAPEREVFMNQSVVDFLLQQYRINFSEIARTTRDHHEYSNTIARQCDVGVDTIEVQCIQVYIAHQEPAKFLPLINQIKKHC